MDSPAAVDDVSLLTSIANRNHTALAELYDRYAKIIYSVAFKSLNSAEECEEVVLDVFAQVWRIADRYDAQKGRADSWLFMLARSRILDRLRKHQRRVMALPTIQEGDLIQIPDSSSDPIESVVVLERRDRLLDVLQTLPDEQRQVIDLAYYQGLSHSQIATQTGLSLGTVKTRIRLGLRKLKLALAPEY